MPVLTHVHLLPVFLVVFTTLAAGFLLKASIRTSGEYLADSRGLPAGWAVPALCATVLGAPELLGLGALGVCGGWLWAGAFLLGAVPALLAAGLWSATRLQQAQTRTTAAFLGLRFGPGLRIASACASALLSVAGAAIGLAIAARTMVSLHILDGLVRGRGWTVESIYPGVVTIAAMVVLLSVLWGGGAGSIRGRSLLFCFLLAGLLPLTLHGADSLGGWSALPAVPATAGFSATFLGHPLVAFALGALLGAVLGSADFRILQVLVNCRRGGTLRRVSLLALIPLLAAGLLAVLPGAVAPQMPTPQTTVTQSEIEGAIVRTTTVARPEEEAGRGLVPAQLDPATGKVQAIGKNVPLEATLGPSKLAVKVLGEQALGIFLAALLAALLSGVAAHLTAVNALLAGDLLPLLQKHLPADEALLRTIRWCAVGTVALAAALALALRSHGPSTTPLLAGYFLVAALLLALLSLLLAAVRVPQAKGRKTARQR